MPTAKKSTAKKTTKPTTKAKPIAKKTVAKKPVAKTTTKKVATKAAPVKKAAKTNEEPRVYRTFTKGIIILLLCATVCVCIGAYFMQCKK